MQKSDCFDFKGISFRDKQVAYGNIDYNALPVCRASSLLIRKWQVRKISERIYNCLRAEWGYRDVDG